ncbi:hypothetical protein HY249_01690 [Candidatus Azambacteria bacterium]|nr:hypothetical protein [Candidatus Azambacteria bacterium]
MAKNDIKNSFLGVCPICRNKLNIKNSNVVNKQNFAYLYCVECKSCSSSVLLAIFPMKDGVVTTMGILTDIQRKEMDLVKKENFITENDVLDLYNYVNSSNSNKKHETKRKK